MLTIISLYIGWQAITGGSIAKGVLVVLVLLAIGAAIEKGKPDK